MDQMSVYAKFIKDLLANKIKLVEEDRENLNEKCIIFIQ